MIMDTFAYRMQSMDMAENTIKAYMQGVGSFFKQYTELTISNVEEWKKRLLTTNKETTVNLRVNAINKYAEIMKLELPHCKNLREKKKTYVEKVLSHDDYIYLKKSLKKDGKMTLYFAVWTMCASGARVSELLKIQAEDYIIGHYEVKSKGGKVRRIYFPRKLCEECRRWLVEIGRTTGPVFLNRFNKVFDKSGLGRMIKKYAVRCGLNPCEVHPHAFRHRFAINFLNQKDDLSLLADILGHSSIETTRIYVRRSADEQRQLLDAIVDW